jgi:hypothetical protein
MHHFKTKSYLFTNLPHGSEGSIQPDSVHQATIMAMIVGSVTMERGVCAVMILAMRRLSPPSCLERI